MQSIINSLIKFVFILLICCFSLYLGIGLYVDSKSAETNINDSFRSIIDIQSEEEYGLKVGQLAPDFSLQTLDGKKIQLKDLRGKKVLLNFWASWCGPCKQEMPAMQQVYEQYKDNKIEIIAVNLTFGRESIDQVEKFVNNYGLTFPIPLDTQAEVQDKYQIFPIPTSYFINEGGQIYSKYFGPMDEEYIMNEFEKMSNT